MMLTPKEEKEKYYERLKFFRRIIINYWEIKDKENKECYE